MRASFHRAPKRFTVAPVVEASTKRMNLNRQPVTVACERAYELLDEEDSQGDAGAKATAATLRNAGLKYCWQLERIGTEDWRALGLNLGVKIGCFPGACAPGSTERPPVNGSLLFAIFMDCCN